MFGIVLLMSGCATGTMTVAGEESQPEPLKLPELVEAERINEDPIVASPEPTITESDPLPGAMVEEPHGLIRTEDVREGLPIQDRP